MAYISEHPRKVRGGAIHDTLEGKKRENELIERLKTRWHDTLEGKKFAALKEAITQEKVETEYLVPEVENFVETPEVKKLKERIKIWLGLGFPVHIIGPTGCGKTTLAMQVAKELGRPTVWINGDEQMTTTDLIGGYSQVETEALRDRFIHNVFKSRDILKADWVDNPLTLACKFGYTLVYNEFSRTLPAANNVLLSVFEEKILELPTKFGEERYVKVHPEFRTIFTSNSIEYAGVHRPQDALLDRMIGIYMDYYDFQTEVEIVKAHTNLSQEVAEKVVKLIRGIRDRLQDVEKVGTRACILLGMGLQMCDGYTKEDMERLCIDVLTSKTQGPMDLSKKIELVKAVIGGI